MRILVALILAATARANIKFEHTALKCHLDSSKIYLGCFRGQICDEGSCVPESILNKTTAPSQSSQYRGGFVEVVKGGFSLDGQCGPTHGNAICDPNSKVYIGVCCSQYGWCGNTPGHCGSGCVSGCPAVPAVNPLDPRSDGKCGRDFSGATCDSKGAFGGCCSSHGWCGTTANHCSRDLGCQNGCTISSEPTIGSGGGGSGVGGVTTEGTCGADNGNTICGNFIRGGCCSAYGFCGNDDEHCGAGCQSGPCQGPPAIPIPSPTPAPANGKQGYFVTVGQSGVPAMHAILMSNGRVVFLDKLENYSQLRLLNGRFAMSSEYDPKENKAFPLSYRTNAFCSGGAFLADGSVLSLGGNAPLLWLDDSIGDGFDAIRSLRRSATDSGLNGKGWVERDDVKLASKRWYATAQTMPDGTIFVASGSLNGLDPTVQSNNNPTYEILNRDGTSRRINYRMEILVRNQPYYMYPIVHLLKDGNLFVFVAKSCQLFNVPSNTVIRDLPGLPGDYRTYPNTGGNVLLPLTSRNGWEPEVLICGGGAYQDVTSPTDASCGRIAPIVPGSNWEMDAMPQGRGMIDGVLLADGTVLWINGGNQGSDGFRLMSKATRQALLYDPKKPKGQRWTTLATSLIPRVYHSSALLMPDGTVMIAGSSPIEMPKLQSDEEDQYVTEYRVETFVPPYLQGSQKYRANNVRISATTLKANGAHFHMTFHMPANHIGTLKIMLHHNGFVTHAVHMGQRIVELDIVGGFPQPPPTGGDITIEVAGPPSNYITPPGPYWIYVVADGMPAEAVHVLID
ncbi:carbohydrate-binding module family 18 protein [Calycina marina]|uniref:Carbohydrate-binding module family 18 protein n=1 Tax=Calycina marina TaxID=1763456 RepID=A0A9P7Z8T6_9HELO|nr:carbohydrate-binding module family 18 protein [Calycina marina]